MQYRKILIASGFFIASAFLFTQFNVNAGLVPNDDGIGIFSLSGNLFDSQDSGEPERKNILLAAAELEQNFAELDLPIGEIEFYPASSSSGKLAVLLPQNHRYPGTGINDSKNDSAELSQNQLYRILNYITTSYKLDFIMNEGDIYGADSDDKVKALKERIELRGRLSRAIVQFNQSCGNAASKEEKNSLLAQAQDLLARLDREIALAGAPYRLAAEKKQIALIGAEDPETYDQCSELVRDYIYQKDQLARCQTGGGSKRLAGGFNPGSGEQLKRLTSLVDSLHQIGGESNSLLSLLSGESGADNSFSESLSKIKASADRYGNGQCGNAIASIEESYGQINAKAGFDSGDSGAQAPERSDNPYSEINNPEVLEGMLDETEASIKQKVIVQRNRETALNFDKALTAQASQAGLLQFGAGHEQGLVEELNELGIGVIVIKSDEVLRREQAEKQAFSPELSAIKDLIQNN